MGEFATDQKYPLLFDKFKSIILNEKSEIAIFRISETFVIILLYWFIFVKK